MNKCEFCGHEYADDEAVWQEVVSDRDAGRDMEEAQLCPECGIASGRTRTKGDIHGA